MAVPRSEAEQRRIQDSLAALLQEVPELVGSNAIGSGPGGRVEVYVPVADRITASAIAALVNDPAHFES